MSRLDGIRKRLKSASLIAGALLALSSAGVAEASPLSYVSHSSPVQANTTDDTGVECPGGTRVVGGGAFMSGTSLETEIRTSAPYDSDGENRLHDNGWSAIGNAGPSDDTITAYGICSNKGPFRYPSAAKNVSARETAKAHCPDGFKVIGGGVQTPRETGGTLVRLVGSTALGLGTPSRSDDGWRGIVDNASAFNIRMTAWAICAKGVKVSGNEASNGIPVFFNNTQDYLTTPACFSPARLTGGGGVVQGAPGGTEIASLEPRDTDMDGTPDDAWRTWFNNESGSAQQMSVESICTEF